MQRVRARLQDRGASALALVLALVLALAAASQALATPIENNGAFNQLSSPQAETSTATTPTTSSSSSSESTNSHTLIFVALGAAVVLLSAIAWVIAHDARRVAPAGDPEVLERDTARETAARLRKRRAKAKAARRQRKRNR